MLKVYDNMQEKLDATMKQLEKEKKKVLNLISLAI